MTGYDDMLRSLLVERQRPMARWQPSPPHPTPGTPIHADPLPVTAARRKALLAAVTARPERNVA